MSQPVYDSPSRWFVRGLAVGLLLMASINTLSYFIRSSSWGALSGRPRPYDESIGFPMEVWQAGDTYGGLFVDYPMLLLNLMFAIVVGSIIGWIAARSTFFLNGVMDQLQPSGPSSQQPVQFTLRGLLIATTIIAILATLARSFAAREETLFAIYIFGPAFLVALAMLPKRIVWQRRVTIIIPATVALIAAAIAVGTRVGVDVDMVLMGIFVCWTPQSSLAALALTAWVLYSFRESPTAARVDPATGGDATG